MKAETRQCAVKSRLLGGDQGYILTSRNMPYTIPNAPENWGELTGIFGGEAETFRRTINMFDAHGPKGDARAAYNEVVTQFDNEARKAKLYMLVDNPLYDPNATDGIETVKQVPDVKKHGEALKKLSEKLVNELREIFGTTGPECAYGLSGRGTKPSADDVAKAKELFRLLNDGSVDYDDVRALAAEYSLELSKDPVVEELALLKKVKRTVDSKNVLSDFGL